MADPPEQRTCASCGLTLTASEQRDDISDEPRSCSTACRERGVRPVDAALEDAIRDLLATRPRPATICPSEAARRVGSKEWRDLMEPARRAARRLVVSGEVEITQRGQVVDPSTAAGPIRVRRAP